MAQRATQWPAWHAATGSGAPAGQLGARQRTAAQAADHAPPSSLARLAVSTRGQESAAQQPLPSFTGSGAYVVVVQSASLAQSAPPGGVGVSLGSGFGVGFGVAVGFEVGVGAAWSVPDEQANARTRRRARRMAGGWQ